MGNKRKNLIFIILPFFLLIVGYSLLYYRFLLEDGEIDYLNQLKGLNAIESEGIITVNILDFDEESCEITCCVYANCNNKLSFPCNKLKVNEFTGEAKYELSLLFQKSKLFPFNDKRYLKEWSIIDMKQVENTVVRIPRESYFNGVKALLTDSYLWEVSSTFMNMSITSVENFSKQEEFTISRDYFKSLFLLKKLSEESNDVELRGIFDREIEYLNENVEEISKLVIVYPEVYVLKLLEYGLDERYISLVDNYLEEDEIREEDNIELVFDKGPLSTEEVYSKEYLDFLLFSESATVLEELGRTKASNYFINQSGSTYNNSHLGIYGLCSYAQTLGGKELINDIAPVLGQVLEEDEKYLIELNIIELVKCKSLSESKGHEISGLDISIVSLLNEVTVKLDEGSFITRALSREDPNRDIPAFLYIFELSDNLEFLLNYE